ncbi:MAG TPA: nuclear transport factor 2 family protein, partial [Ktedonobacterales bacterium]|nr:nuclear transport factor 2 family protein [Ktedonobacterales bacterium]
MSPQDFLRDYERQTNTHEFANVAPLLADDAVYWFDDGSFYGVDEIRDAFARTWAAIQNERYAIADVRWLWQDNDSAACIYTFSWQGTVNGGAEEGSGRGTSLLCRRA